jgi:hypothetical protein
MARLDEEHENKTWTLVAGLLSLRADEAFPLELASTLGTPKQLALGYSDGSKNNQQAGDSPP